MNKFETYQYLRNHNISFEAIEHPAVFNMEEAAAIDLPYPECEAKNLFVRDDKRRGYYLITVKGDKRVNLKSFRQQHGLRALSFASAEELLAVMRLTPGAVTPLGILNDTDRRVHFYLDAEFAGGRIAVHPNENTATVLLKTKDLLQIIKEHGNAVDVISI